MCSASTQIGHAGDRLGATISVHRSALHRGQGDIFTSVYEKNKVLYSFYF